MRFRNVLAIVSIVFSLAGCSLFQSSSTTTTPATFDICNAVQIAEAEQTAAEGATAIVDQMHAGKSISDANYKQATFAYAALREANDEARDALIQVNDHGSLSMADYALIATKGAIAAAKFYAVYTSLTKQAAPSAGRRRAAATAGACTITDAEITSKLTMPAWPLGA